MRRRSIWACTNERQSQLPVLESLPHALRTYLDRVDLDLELAGLVGGDAGGDDGAGDSASTSEGGLRGDKDVAVGGREG